jgi:hypothetical protein
MRNSRRYPAKPVGVIFRTGPVAFVLLAGLLSGGLPVFARSEPEPVPVRHLEGLLHGFLLVRSVDGELLGTGDLSQVNHSGKVVCHMILHLKDGSVNDETVTFSQGHIFRLLKYELIQKGPVFKTQSDLTIDGATGQVTVRYSGQDGSEKTASSHLKLPVDLANGMVPILIKNLAHGASLTTVSMIATTPKPRLVKLDISPEGQDTFRVGDSGHKATRYVIKVRIGGVAGVLAPIVGKQPPDTHMWVLEGDAPTFVKSEGPLFEGGPVWRIELVSPAWPKDSTK